MKKLIIAFAASALMLTATPVFADPSTTASEQSSTQLSAMAQAQAKLKELGLYDGEISGVRTTATARAIRRFQRAHNLQVDGTLNDATKTAMGL